MKSILRDPRDIKLLRTFIATTITSLLGLVLFLFAFRSFDSDAPRFCLFFWSLGAVVYSLLLVKTAGPFILMEHAILHRKTFTRKFEWLERVMIFFINPFFGQTFFSYSAHHIGMHHVEENGEADLSSTEGYQRDSFRDFLRYFFSFFTVAGYTLPRYFLQKGRKKLFYRSIFSEWGFFLILAGLSVLNPIGTLVVFITPLIVVRFFMISGNWAQHAFLNPESRTHPVDYSIICIDTPYNELCFNDGYHAQHHENPTLHWSELPAAFESKREQHLENGAVVFQGVDYLWIWWKLMRKDYVSLASKLLVADSGLKGKTKVEFLQERLRPVLTVPVITSHTAHTL